MPGIFLNYDLIIDKYTMLLFILTTVFFRGTICLTDSVFFPYCLCFFSNLFCIYLFFSFRISYGINGSSLGLIANEINTSQ